VLIEALIAFAITASAVIMSLSGFAQGAGRLKRAEERLLALAEARSIVAELSGAQSLTPSTRTGVTQGGFAWAATISENAISATPFLAKPIRISLTVTMQGADAPLIAMETYVISGLGGE
jgi:hypothetical protein